MVALSFETTACQCLISFYKLYSSNYRENSRIFRFSYQTLFLLLDHSLSLYFIFPDFLTLQPNQIIRIFGILYNIYSKVMKKILVYHLTVYRSKLASKENCLPITTLLAFQYNPSEFVHSKQCHIHMHFNMWVQAGKFTQINQDES